MLSQFPTRRCVLGVAALSLVIGLIMAPLSFGDLNSRQRSLQQSINSDNTTINAYRGRLSDLRSRLTALESSLVVQQSVLARVQNDLSGARSRLVALRDALVRDRGVLARQLVAEYESPTPDLAGLVLESRGFNDLLERMDQMKRIAAHNARVVRLVAHDKHQVARQIPLLAASEARQRRVTAAVLVERDQVARLHLAVLEREQVAVRDRARKQVQLRQVRHQLAVLQARAAAAERAALTSQSGGSGFTPDGGAYGFFPAPGTNYSVGQEPEIAARLDRLGKALHLHLIGLSGYRTPQHSVEVGGFADDPHTRGEASDTPGVEGVPESTLLQFGLTRPFPGPAEADHIQLA